MFNTLDVLKRIGFVDNNRYANTNEVFNWKYEDDYFELTATIVPRYMKYITGDYCICINGILHTKHTLGSLEFHMPVEFATERDCIAWFFCNLSAKLKDEWKEYCLYKKPPVELTRSDYFVLPQCIEEKEKRVDKIYNLKKKLDTLHFVISKKELSRLRKLINDNETTDIIKEAKVYFDGDFVTWKAKDYKFAGTATGIEWPNSINITYNHEWHLPVRLLSSVYEFSFCRDGLFINDICNPEVKVTGNTVGKVDRFEPELLSWLLKLAYFYPRYDYEKYKTFDADDFKKWVLQEVGSLVKPYLDCLTAMMAPYPLYQDNLDVSKMENAIKFFKQYPEGTGSAELYVAWEKIFPSDDDLVLFGRAEAGWKCWCNSKTL